MVLQGRGEEMSDLFLVSYLAEQVRCQEAEAALRAIEEQANKWIGDCCGERERFCEHFGCVTIRALTAPARAYFEKWSRK